MEIRAFTTPGLVKPVNEDILGLDCVGNELKACLCDGHWGKQAACLACQVVMKNFPLSKKRAFSVFNQIQSELFRSNSTLNPPETSVLAIQIDMSKLIMTLASYGDCRLLIVRQNRILYSLPTYSTWLGALSYQIIRNRLAVKKATIFRRFRLTKGDKIYIFTDGIDECVYETPTIPHDWIIKHSASAIINRVYSHGAQDNASLIILKC